MPLTGGLAREVRVPRLQVVPGNTVVFRNLQRPGMPYSIRGQDISVPVDLGLPRPLTTLSGLSFLASTTTPPLGFGEALVDRPKNVHFN
jgi:hypothetical protein